ncbi:MAG: redoxin domain-containing protein [Verrucomicrobiales bacterium]|nr:redoxin domain-containing protein [Verrucomicrobiales bacterium]
MKIWLWILVKLVVAVCPARSEISFSGTRLDGTDFELTKENAASCTVVCFLGTECPLVLLYGPRLETLQTGPLKDQIQVLGVMSNSQDTQSLIQQYRDETGITFPIILDSEQLIADQFGATRTPEVFVLDRELKIRYQGRIDDQYEPGISRSEVKREDLKIAVTELLNNNDISKPTTPAVGCIIGRAAKGRAPVSSSVTYYKDVLPVLQTHCIECHRKGQIGPFSMSHYRRVSGWADTMLETIEDGRMPPWHADPTVGHFQNSRHMPESDKQIIRDWIANGKPEGNPGDAPAAPTYVDTWQLGQAPDLIVEMAKQPFTVPKGGTVEYQYFIADPKFTEDKWIRAAEVIPGNRSVVHHVIVFVRPPDGQIFRGASLLTGYVPGQRIIPSPKTHARKVVAGSKLVFQVHYTPNGREAEDLSKIGLVFADENEVTHEMYSLIALQQEFEIPPNTANHRVSARLRRLPPGGELLAISPHMHYRGKSFEVYGSEDASLPILKVPNYDFNWQHSYILNEPIPFSELQTLRFEATFDNSADNPFNPDPDRWIMWGDQTWEEMAVAFFEVAVPREKKKKSSSISKIEQPDVADYIDRCFAEMDRNEDGIIKEKEAPLAARLRWFKFVDRNGDKVVTREELEKNRGRIFP